MAMLSRRAGIVRGRMWSCVRRGSHLEGCLSVTCVRLQRMQYICRVPLARDIGIFDGSERVTFPPAKLLRVVNVR